MSRTTRMFDSKIASVFNPKRFRGNVAIKVKQIGFGNVTLEVNVVDKSRNTVLIEVEEVIVRLEDTVILNNVENAFNIRLGDA